MPLQATSGAASYDGFGGGVAVVPNYIEDVFSTWLYTGTGASQTITNGIDLSTNGGLIWFKPRNTGNNHNLIDSARGINKFLITNATNAEGTAGAGYGVTSFNTTGFTLGDPWTSSTNTTSTTYASWTFRKQPKFFDIVTYTGDGSAGFAVAHNLGSVPGCIIVKKIAAAAPWQVYHRSLPTGTNGVFNLVLNTTAAQIDNGQFSSTADATNFYLGPYTNVNQAGQSYVAYIFAHDAGGFGLSGADNVISCGSFTTGTGLGAFDVSLGWEPQWVLIKRTDSATGGDWRLLDTMRGFDTRNLTGDAAARSLYPNTSQAEEAGGYIGPYATGFSSTYTGTASATYIYIAIRRGPMRVPTLGTSVFAPTTQTGTGSARSVTGLGFPPDMVMLDSKSFANNFTYDKLRGPNIRLFTNDTAAEVNDANRLTSFDQNGYSLGNLNPNESGISYANWNFRRAPGFFDEVCYTGTGSATTFAHNLGVVPELMIVKNRVTGTNWAVYTLALGATKTLFLNLTNDPSTITSVWNDTAPTASVFAVGSAAATNTSTNTYVNYLFATCAGVSKVGSYTGTGATQTINCGFTAGARFVLIKRTDSTGDWYVWDTARGIVSGNDPYLLLNSTAAEVTSTDYIDTASTGFEISSTAPAAINASGGTFIFLAIA